MNWVTPRIYLSFGNSAIIVVAAGTGRHTTNAYGIIVAVLAVLHKCKAEISP